MAYDCGFCVQWDPTRYACACACSVLLLAAKSGRADAARFQSAFLPVHDEHKVSWRTSSIARDVVINHDGPQLRRPLANKKRSTTPSPVGEGDA